MHLKKVTFRNAYFISMSYLTGCSVIAVLIFLFCYFQFQLHCQNGYEVAHAVGVSVEAELGSLAAGENSHEGKKTDKEIYTDPEKAKEFIEETNVDALAVSIGTVHGLYKGTPNIRVDILKEINEKCNIPLVLHGGSGTAEEKIKECIKNGISKINVNTEISDYVISKTKELLESEKPHFSVLSLKQQEFVEEVVLKYINLFR